MSRQYFERKVAIVTGSSMGIGKAIASSLGASGAKVVINARNQERLLRAEQELAAAGVDVLAVAGDVTDIGFCQSLIKETMAVFGRIDILVNNVGVSSRGDFQELAPEVFRKVMEVNYLGAVYPTKAALPAIVDSQGSVMFISSQAGIRGIQGISAYCAAKMPLTAIADALRVELADTGVHVGITHVGYTRNNPEKKIYGASGELIPLSDRDSQKAQSPEMVARTVLRNLKKRKQISIPGFLGKVNRLLNVLTPSFVDWVLVKANRRIKKLSD